MKFLGHLCPDDLKYFSHWYNLIILEAHEEKTRNDQKDMWSQSSEERERQGKCLNNMIVTNERKQGKASLQVNSGVPYVAYDQSSVH